MILKREPTLADKLQLKCDIVIFYNHLKILFLGYASLQHNNLLYFNSIF